MDECIIKISEQQARHFVSSSVSMLNHSSVFGEVSPKFHYTYLCEHQIWLALSLHKKCSYLVWAERLLESGKLLCHTWLLHNVRLELLLTPKSSIGSVLRFSVWQISIKNSPVFTVIPGGGRISAGAQKKELEFTQTPFLISHPPSVPFGLPSSFLP